MLEDRIIVQDRGIDAGLAALMQNANKGMDPAALMAMMNNNGGFGGNGGWWWIWIILKEPTNTEDPRIKELQDEVNELKNIIKQASSMVPPPMKQMLPQNMQNVMKEVDQ